MTPILTFDIATLPDVAGLRRLQGLDNQVSDHEVAEMAWQLRRQQIGSDLLPPHLQRVVAISCTLRREHSFKVWSLGTADESEASLLQRFFDGLEKLAPQLVTWNGNDFALPVLHSRSLIHGVSSPHYWAQRASERHHVLQDSLGLHHAHIPPQQLLPLLGLPVQTDMDSLQRWQAWQNGQLAALHQQGECNAIGTYLLYARSQRLRGLLTPDGWQQECALVRHALQDHPHLHAYLAAWPA